MFLILLLLLPVIYISIVAIIVKNNIRNRIIQQIDMCAYPFCYPFKVKNLTQNYFLEANKGVILFHPKPLERLYNCKEFEELINRDDIIKLDYARRNSMSDMLAHNYLTFIKDISAPFY